MTGIGSSFKHSVTGLFVTAALGLGTVSSPADNPAAAAPPDATRVQRESAEPDQPKQDPSSPTALKADVLQIYLDALPAKDNAGQEQSSLARIKVFRLRHRRPEEIQPLLEGLLVDTAWEAGLPIGARLPGPGGNPGRGYATSGSSRPAPGPVGGAADAGSRISQGFGWRIVVDQRTRSLIVRADDRNLQTAADLVAVLDVAPGNPIPRVKSLRALKLRHAHVEPLAEVLQQLGTQARIVADAPTNTLIIAGPDSDTRDISDVINALDVEVKNPDESKPDKRLERGLDFLKRSQPTKP